MRQLGNYVIRQLREDYHSAEMAISEERVLEKMKEASETERLPEDKRINERLLELHIPREGSEEMKINIR